ncbi:hypothetical protein [Paenibacillus luteus]|uniref:hypothetical protein n=1 Tax=Paenibacillus luteus TaxID=2545753 RepID=UPI0019D5E239|nr:hypothetical protein [Paenibacillus luteus]
MRQKYFIFFLLLIVLTGCSEKTESKPIKEPTEDTIVIDASFPSENLTNQNIQLNIIISLNREEKREITGSYKFFTRKIADSPKLIKDDTFFKGHISLNEKSVEKVTLEKVEDGNYQIDITVETPSNNGNKRANIKTLFFSVNDNIITLQN